MDLASRQDSLGFAERCRKNLAYIEAAYQSGDDVHVVTQIVVSSLGLIVFPWEQKADLKIRGVLLSELEKLQWPKWNETKPSARLGGLLKNLRDAIAHGNVKFSSDDRDAANVQIAFDSQLGSWHAEISARDLQLFCLKFIQLIQDTIG